MEYVIPEDRERVEVYPTKADVILVKGGRVIDVREAETETGDGKD